MKVVLPSLIENPVTAEQIDSNAKIQQVLDKYTDLFESFQHDYNTLFAAQEPAIIVEDLISYFRGLDLVIYLAQLPTLTDPSEISRQQAEVTARGITYDVTNPRPEMPGSKYFRIPLDEPHFEIDTDTRSITVPTAFSQNGLGVVGDANAEIVFFECPRYYDTVDLYTMVQNRHCYVQWLNTSSKKSGNSEVLLCDVTPTTMYLGWMITQAMTDTAGTLEFSMRWFQTEGEGANEKIIYSLSTQKASCPIKVTLALTIDQTKIEDVSDIVYTRPIYAHVVNSMEGLSPRIVLTLAGESYNLIPINRENVIALYNLKITDYDSEEDFNGYVSQLVSSLQNQYPIGTYPDGIYLFKVEAQSPDSKSISYQWYRNGQKITLNGTSDTLTVIEPGTYWVEMGNGDASGYRYVTSPSNVIPAPGTIKYDNLDENKYFGYGVFSAPTSNEANAPILALTADITADDGTAPNGKVHVVWKRAEMIANGALVEDPASRNYVTVKTEDLTAAAGQTFVKSTYQLQEGDEGWYICEASNKLNNQSSTVITPADVVTVRAVPQQPTNVTIRYNADTQQIVIDELTFANGAPANYHPNEIYYQWSDGSDISAAAGGAGFNVRYLNVNPNTITEFCEKTYNVKVSHRIFNNNKVTDTAASGTAVAKNSSIKASNNITLQFTPTSTGTRVTVV